MYQQMQRTTRKLGRTGHEVTLIGFGALEIGRNWGIGTDADRLKPAPDEAGQVLNGVLDLGINLIDTASAYHYSEERIGHYLATRRSEYLLTSKCGEHTGPNETCYYDFSYQAVTDSIDQSLRLLQTDRIDVMQIHFGPDPEQVLDAGETVRAMLDAQEAGKIRHLGASAPNHLALRCVEMGVFDVIQVAYSLLDRSAEPAIALAQERGVGVLIRSGFGGGLLTPRVLKRPDLLPKVLPYLDLLGGDASRLPALALAFLKRNPGVSSVLAGSKQLEHVQANLVAAEAGVAPEILEAAVCHR
jgi:aryl-alcohol dehydrogenase-like predicted oxidoreductase